VVQAATAIADGGQAIMSAPNGDSVQAEGADSQSSGAHEYSMEELKQRRAEIERLIGTIEANQTNALLLTAGAWSWLATNSEKIPPSVSIFILPLPAVLSCLFALRWRALEGWIRLSAAYIMKLERQARLPESTGGWENFIIKHPNPVFRRIHKVFWLLLLLVNVVMAVGLARS
jgi:hypothetical protein